MLEASAQVYNRSKPSGWTRCSKCHVHSQPRMHTFRRLWKVRHIIPDRPYRSRIAFDSDCLTHPTFDHLWSSRRAAPDCQERYRSVLFSYRFLRLCLSVSCRTMASLVCPMKDPVIFDLLLKRNFALFAKQKK